LSSATRIRPDDGQSSIRSKEYRIFFYFLLFTLQFIYSVNQVANEPMEEAKGIGVWRASNMSWRERWLCTWDLTYDLWSSLPSVFRHRAHNFNYPFFHRVLFSN
jgi:hypothetical protein